MKDYIHFFKNNDALVCHIFDSKSHKTRVITNPKNINLLLSILKNYGYQNIKGNYYITKDVKEIYAKYLKTIKKNKNTLKIYNILKHPFSLKKVNKNTKKIILRIFLASAVIIYILSTKKEPTFDEGTIETEITIDDNNFDDYIVETEIVIDEGSFDDNMEVSTPETTKPFTIRYETSALDDTYNETNESSSSENQKFKFSFEDRTESEAYENVKKYESIFKKYGEMYGIDYHIIMAIAAQESNGDHYNNLYNGPAEGIMQIEKSVHLNNTLTAYNFLNKSEESIVVTKEALDDLETNIKIGTMILQNVLTQQNYNIPLAIQTYNFGPGNIQKVLNTCSSIEGIDTTSLLNDNYEWMNYREFLNIGDPLYVEHILSYIPSKTITVTTTAGETRKLELSNEYSKTASL